MIKSQSTQVRFYSKQREQQYLECSCKGVMPPMASGVALQGGAGAGPSGDTAATKGEAKEKSGRQGKKSTEGGFSSLFLLTSPQGGSSGQHTMKAEEKVGNAAWIDGMRLKRDKASVRDTRGIRGIYTAVHSSSRPPTGRFNKEFRQT